MSTIKHFSPFSGVQVFEADKATFSEVNQKIERARAAYRRWSRVPVAERSAAVRSALEIFREAKEGVSRSIAQETGKTVAAAQQEMDFMLERAEYMCTLAEDGSLNSMDLGKYNQNDFEGTIRYRGKGVVYIISPWNYPLVTAINGVVGALLGGNTVILKHTTTPSVGTLFERAFHSMGGHGDLLFNITVDFEVSDEIITSANINHVVFTGSVNGGRAIQQNVAKRALNEELDYPFIEASLELGSNDAAYIAEDADIDHAVQWAVKTGRLHNSGQSCCAVKRVYVHETLYDEFLDKAKTVFDAEVSGNPEKNETTLGPLFGGKAAIDVLLELVFDASQKGARIVTGGAWETVDGCDFIQPTLVADVDHDMRIMREETFGPVLPVMKVASDTEALGLIGDTKFGLTASIFTTSRDRAERFVGALDFGTLYVNRCNFVDARLGWIGHRHSGNGSIALSPEGLRAFCQKASINIDPSNLK
jgi:acyl-CoA reductase-like NAD-dependent aldehyde dehydrogenase